MKSLVVLTFAAGAWSAGPALAQGKPAHNPFATNNPSSESQFGNRNLSFRINEIVGRDGSRERRRSILAGFDVAPGTVVGLGLFDSGPKAKGRGPHPRFDQLAKRSRKAAVGLSLRF